MASFLSKLLSAIFGGGNKPSFNGNFADPLNWDIGPTIKGDNRSVGMPPHPTANGDGSWYIDLPQGTFPPVRHIHYVTCPYGSLIGKSRMRIKGRIDLSEGAKIYARSGDHAGYVGLMSLYFQRKNDNWTANSKYETYRWYASFATLVVLDGGAFEIIAPLQAAESSLWSATRDSTCLTPSGVQTFIDAKRECDNVGFVLGGGDGLGHGLYVEGGTARLTVTEFAVE